MTAEKHRLADHLLRDISEMQRATSVLDPMTAVLIAAWEMIFDLAFLSSTDETA